MGSLKEWSQWLGILFLISAAARVVCMVFLPTNPAGFVALGLMGMFLAAFGAVCLLRLVLHLLGKDK